MLSLISGVKLLPEDGTNSLSAVTSHSLGNGLVARHCADTPGSLAGRHYSTLRSNTVEAGRQGGGGGEVVLKPM